MFTHLPEEVPLNPVLVACVSVQPVRAVQPVVLASKLGFVTKLLGLVLLVSTAASTTPLAFLTAKAVVLLVVGCTTN